MATEFDSVCPLDCPDTCSLTVTVDGGRLLRLDGSHRNPTTAGFICAKVRGYARRQESPLRLLYPQRRVGAKGEGRFERATWDEALAEIAARLTEIREREGGEAILPYHYGGSNGLFGEDALDARFFHRLGASALDKTICAAPTGAVYGSMYGGMAGVPPEDYALARAIVLWGVNPSATSIHLVPHVRTARRAGAYLAVVDPRRTPLARAADLHLQPRPGTDVVLALSLIHEFVRRDLVDHDFVDRCTNGFEELVRAAAEFPSERAASICDVAAAGIEELAVAYAERAPAVIRCGWGVERNRNGGAAVRAILALPAVAGKFGVRGGGVTMSLSRAFPFDREGLARPDLGRRPVRRLNMTQLGRILLERSDPPVRALFVYNANPVAMTPDQGAVVRGLSREDLFTVVHEQVLTDTARYADWLLPAQTFLEHDELHRSYGHTVAQYAAAVLPPAGEALSNPELFARLARAMGFDEPALAATPAELLADALPAASARLGGADAGRLRREKAIRLDFDGDPSPVAFVNQRPGTPSGRVELAPASLGPLGYRPLVARHPLALLSPASGRTVNSIFGETLGEARLDLHPADAAARGIADGALVRVYNELGEVRLRVRLTDDVRPGVVCLPKGLWRSSTGNGWTSTALVPDALTDVGEGACFNDARVEVEPLD